MCVCGLRYPACSAGYLRLQTHTQVCVVVQYFSTLSHKRHDYRGETNLLNVKCVFDVLPSLRSQHFSFWEEFNEILEMRGDLLVKHQFSCQILENKTLKFQILWKSVHLGTELLNADGRTDRQDETNSGFSIFGLRSIQNTSENSRVQRVECGNDKPFFYVK